jgi:ATP diphosphatase
LTGLARAAELGRKAAKVGFDWNEIHPVMDKVASELDELREAVVSSGAISDELGDLLFSVVNVARHLGVEPELALRSANHRFEARFRSMESEGPFTGLSLEDLDARWERAKLRTRT